MTIIVSAAAAAASASQVPSRYDVIIGGNGYRFADTEQQRAVYSYTPTFVQRTNVQGDYSDNQQDFWLTVAQRDWSLGEQQKFYRADETRSRRYYRGSNVDVRTPGQVTMRQATASLTFGAAVTAVHTDRGPTLNQVAATSSSNLYTVDSAGTITSQGAHGLGAAPSMFGLASDGKSNYISTTSSGTVGVRRWNGSAFSTFSASGADSLEFLNNTLYGFRNDNAKLVRWDSAGTQSDIFQWKQAEGSAADSPTARLEVFGGKLLVLINTGLPDGPALFLYDGLAPAMIATFPPNFASLECAVVIGIPFISGCFRRESGSNTEVRPAIFFYQNGQLGLLWQADAYMTASASGNHAHAPALAPLDGGMAFTDDTTGKIMFYDPVSGGVHSIGSYTVSATSPCLMGSTLSFAVVTRAQTAGYLFPDKTTTATTATITTSLADFDSSLDKTFKSLKVDADIPSGASVDLAYRIGDLDGAYTTLVTGAASGTEYDIDQNGRSISVRMTLNKGSSSAGPTIKRLYGRAAPVLDTFRKREYILDLSGRDGESSLQLRDGSMAPKDGKAMAEDLISSATATEPITIIDRFGTYTGIIEPEGFRLIEVRPEEFVAVVPVREV